MTMKVTAIPTELAETIRGSTRDAQGNTLEPELQDAYGNPCRHCLRRANPGESLILFSYSPFERRNAFKEHGPVFVHANACGRYDDARALPEDFRGRPIVLRGYDREQRIARVAVVVDGETGLRVEQLLADPAIEFVHARSFTHGCFLFRIDRD